MLLNHSRTMIQKQFSHIFFSFLLFLYFFYFLRLFLLHSHFNRFLYNFRFRNLLNNLFILLLCLLLYLTSWNRSQDLRIVIWCRVRKCTVNFRGTMLYDLSLGDLLNLFIHLFNFNRHMNFLFINFRGFYFNITLIFFFPINALFFRRYFITLYKLYWRERLIYWQ